MKLNKHRKLKAFSLAEILIVLIRPMFVGLTCLVHKRGNNYKLESELCIIHGDNELIEPKYQQHIYT